MKGLKIGDTVVHSISGPSRFSFLRPTIVDPAFPLLILFGDHHRSREGMCDDEDEDDDKEKKIKRKSAKRNRKSKTKKSSKKSKSAKKNSYVLSDPAFLKLLDSLGRIDFYTETFYRIGTGIGFSGGVMEDLTTGQMMMCYEKHRNAVYRSHCPTQNIRWHGGDARFAGIGSINYSGGIDPVWYQLSTTYEYHQASVAYYENQNIEYHLIIAMESVLKYGKNHDLLALDQALSRTFFGSRHGILEWLSPMFYSSPSPPSPPDVRQFVYRLFSMMTPDNSVIFKQIQKQTYPLLRSMEFWAECYVFLLYDHFKDMNGPEMIQTMQRLTDDREMREMTEFEIILIREVLNELALPLFELYTLSRIFKQPSSERGDKRSTLSIVYAGNRHTEQMKSLLISTGLYALGYATNQENPKKDGNIRCQTIEERIDLSEEMDKRKKQLKRKRRRERNGRYE